MTNDDFDEDRHGLRPALPPECIPLGLRLLDTVLRLSGADDVAKSSDEEIIAAQKPLPRNALTNFLFGARSTATSLEIRSLHIDGEDRELRLHRPLNASPDAAVLYLHGGGWVGGDAGMSDWWCSQFAAQASVLVASISYRLAPAHRFPVPLEDGYRALYWLSENSAQLGVPGNLIVAGDSAGGNLAAALCLLAHKRRGPAICRQILINPALDLTFASPSVQENANAPLLSEASIKAYARLYLGDQDPAIPLVSPIHSPDLAGLPPALIQVGQYDPLRDDGWRYAASLQRSGIPVQVTEYPGAPHGLVNFPGLSRIAGHALKEAVDYISG